MRFFVLKSSKLKNDDKYKPLSGVRLVAVVVACALGVTVGLFLLLSPRFKPMTDVPPVPLIYAEDYWGDTYSLDFQTGSRTLISNENMSDDFSESDEVMTFWVCADDNCYTRRLMYGTGKEISDDQAHRVGPSFYGSDKSEGDRIHWSSDGQWVAFYGYLDDDDTIPERVDEEKRELWIINSQTNVWKRLTYNDVPDWDPSFSPDGSHLVYLSGSWGHEVISILEISTGRLRAIADVPYASEPLWSPDGDWIAFETPSPGEQNKLYWTRHVSIVRVDGTHLQSITTGPSRLIGWDTTAFIERTP